MRLFLALLIGASCCYAQALTNAHKGHGNTDYKMTEMGPPSLMKGVGQSHLKITTKSPRAQASFDQGLSLLHCFWDFEAYRAFKEAARLDPQAPMPYWGIVQAVSDYKGMEQQKQAALAKIKELLPKASDHEQYYLRAVQKEEEAEDGQDAWRREMESLIDRYPEDIDAKLLLAIGIQYGYNTKGLPRRDAVYARLLVQDVLRNHPDSAAAHHYMIHILESGPHSAEALPDAEVLAALAPGSGHMVHMPGHIYFNAGDYELARKSFLDSMHVDEDYMRREKVSTLDDWNYAHNLSYLIAADAESGRYREALEIAEKLQKLPANPFLAKNSPAYVLTVGGSTARLNERYGNWDATIRSPIHLGVSEAEAGPAAAAYRDGMVAYAKGMAALSKKDAKGATRDSDALDAIAWRLHVDLNKDDENDGSNGVLEMLQMLSLDLRGNICSLQGKTGKAIELLKRAVEQQNEIGYREPPEYGRLESESLGYAYLSAHRYGEARAAFQEALKARPKNGHSLYGLAQSYEVAGDEAGAEHAYREFLSAWSNADQDLEMVQHAKSKSHLRN